MIIETIVEVASNLFNLGNLFKQAKRERRDRASEYFGGLGKTIGEVADSLRKDIVPHGKCEEVRIHAMQLPDVVGKEIGEAKAKDLAKKLFNAHEVEMLLSELSAKVHRLEPNRNLPAILTERAGSSDPDSREIALRLAEGVSDLETLWLRDQGPNFFARTVDHGVDPSSLSHP